jgi:hypothetical protein
MISHENVLKYLVSYVAFLAFFIIPICSLTAGTAYAQSSPMQRGLTVSPLRSELNIAPGTSLDGVLTVTNSSDKVIGVNLSAEEFSVINQQYDYAFTAESNMSKWITFSQSELSLAIGEAKKVTFNVGVPLSAEPGGRYISLFASTDSGKQAEGVNSRQRVASLLYITVLGDVTRAGHLLSLTSPWVIFDKSIWSASIQNTGTTHFRSRYSVKIMSLFWDNTVANSSGDVLILPGTIRSVPDILPQPNLPGIYKIIYTIGLGDTPAKTETRYMLYMPLWANLVTAAGALFLVFLLIRKRLNKH